MRLKENWLVWPVSGVSPLNPVYMAATGVKPSTAPCMQGRDVLFLHPMLWQAAGDAQVERNMVHAVPQAGRCRCNHGQPVTT